MPKLRFLVTATAVLAGGLLPACGDDDGTGLESIFGLYLLQTINGNRLPTDVAGFEFTSGFIILSTDGTYSLSVSISPGMVNENTGTFTVDGSTVDFDEGAFTGTVTPPPPNQPFEGFLTIFLDGNTFVYRKSG